MPVAAVLSSNRMRVWTSPARRAAATRLLRTPWSGGSAAVLVAVRLALGLVASGNTDQGVGAESAKTEAKPADAAISAKVATGPESSGTNFVTKNSPAAATSTRGSTNAPAAKSEGKSDNAPKALALDYPSFRMVSERNIFNADRTRRTSRSFGSGSRPPAVPVTSVSLVGFLGSQQGDRAFFDGSSSAYRKAIKVGETIGDFKLSAVSPTGVVLETGERKISLKIGEQLRREESGPWKTSEGPSTAGSSRTNSSPETAEGTAADGDSAAPAESAGGNNAAADDVLARLLKKRQQEENK